MNRHKSRAWIARWLAPLGWGAAAVLLGFSLLRPLPDVEPRTFAWALSLCVLVALVGHLAAPHAHDQRRVTPVGLRDRQRATETGHGDDLRPIAQGPNLYRGRSHSGARPRFD